MCVPTSVSEMGNQTLINTEPSVWSAIYNAENRPVRRQIEVLFQGIKGTFPIATPAFVCVARCLPRRGEETPKPLKSIGTANGQTFSISAPSSPTSASAPPSTARATLQADPAKRNLPTSPYPINFAFQPIPPKPLQKFGTRVNRPVCNYKYSVDDSMRNRSEGSGGLWYHETKE